MEQYLFDMDWIDIENAISMFDMDKKAFDSIMDWIWKKERKPFEIFG